MAVYKPLNNKYFDKYFLDLRSKFNVRLVSMRDTLHEIIKYERQRKLVASLFISDQSPVSTEIQHWMNFLNQETPLYTGMEKIARKYNIPVVFCKMNKIKRGYYQAELIPVAYEPEKTVKNEITERHTRILEDIIIEKPWLWLWTHRRWKYTREDVIAKKYVKN